VPTFTDFVCCREVDTSYCFTFFKLKNQSLYILQSFVASIACDPEVGGWIFLAGTYKLKSPTASNLNANMHLLS
jgi:hypothetical protein